MNFVRSLVVVLLATCAPFTAYATTVQEVVGKSGVKAWLVEEHSLPIIAVKIAFDKSGYAYDPKGEEGRANMTAALLMEGAGELDAQAFSNALADRAIRLQTGVGEDQVFISMETLSEHRAAAFGYLDNIINAPRFDASAVARVKSQTISLIKQLDAQPGYQLQEAWLKAMLGDHPYARPQAGTAASVAKFDAADAKNVVRRYFARNQLIIAVAGDITPDALRDILDTHFAKLPEAQSPDNHVEEAVLVSEAKTTHVSFELPQTMVAFGAPAIKRNDERYIAAYVTNHLLGGAGSLNSLLGEAIREKRGLAYSVYSSLMPFSYAGLWRGGFSTRSDQAKQAITTLRETLAHIAKTGASDVELAETKQYLTGAFVLSLDSNADVANFLLTMQLHDLGIDYLDRRNGLINAVTLDQVKDMAKMIADPEKLVLTTVGNTPE